MSEIRDTLNERAKTHGDYAEHAAIAQSIKRQMRHSPNWLHLEFHKAETLDMIAHKIGRILAGDSSFHDHWHDIAGYATLTADRLKKAGEQ